MFKRCRLDSDDDEDDTYVTVKTEVNPFATQGNINWPNEEEEEEEEGNVYASPALSSSFFLPRDRLPIDQHRNPTGLLCTEATDSSVGIPSSTSQPVSTDEKTRGTALPLPPCVIASDTGRTESSKGAAHQASASAFPPAFVQPCDKDIPEEYFAVLPSSILLRSYWTTLQYLFGKVDTSAPTGCAKGGGSRRRVNDVTVLAQYMPSKFCTTQAAAALWTTTDREYRLQPGWRWDGVVRGRKKKS